MDWTNQGVLGNIPSPCVNWGEAQPELKVEFLWSTGRSDWDSSFAQLARFAEDMDKAKIRVAAVILPMSPAYRNTDYYSRHGGKRSNVLEYLDSVRALDSRLDYFRFMDFHKDGQHDFTDVEALDYDHLCTAGAMRVSDSLSARIQDWN
jgi:hypothetical protein